MYQHYYAIDHLPAECLTILNEIYPQEKSDIKMFLKNTQYCHDLDQWAHETRSKKQWFLKKYKLSKFHYSLIKKALNSSNEKLSQPISLLGKTYTKILKTKEFKKQQAFYFRPMKIYLTN